MHQDRERKLLSERWRELPKTVTKKMGFRLPSLPLQMHTWETGGDLSAGMRQLDKGKDWGCKVAMQSDMETTNSKEKLEKASGHSVHLQEPTMKMVKLLKTIPQALACGSVHGLYLTWVALGQMSAQEALGAAWPQPRAGAQTCGKGTVGSPRWEAMCLGCLDLIFRLVSCDACYPPPLPVPGSSEPVKSTTRIKRYPGWYFI